MAVINYSTAIGEGRHFIRVLWETMATGDTGDPIMLPEWADKAVHVVGTFGGATVTLKGSNDKTNWITLRDPRGGTNALSFIATDLQAVLENPMWIRPEVAGGAGVDIDVYVIATQKRPR